MPIFSERSQAYYYEKCIAALYGSRLLALVLRLGDYPAKRVSRLYDAPQDRLFFE